MSTSPTPKEINTAIAELLRRGWIKMVLGDDGELRYLITERGVKHIDDLLKEPEDD